VGTSGRVVRKVTSLPGSPGRLKGGDPRVSASLGKREGFRNLSEQICISGCSKRATILEQRALVIAIFDFRTRLHVIRNPPQCCLRLADCTVSRPSTQTHYLPIRRCDSGFARNCTRFHVRAKLFLVGSRIPLDENASAWPGFNLQFHNSHSFQCGSHGVCRENPCLVGQGFRWRRAANSFRCEVSGTEYGTSVSTNDGSCRRRCAGGRAHGNRSGPGLSVSRSHWCASVRNRRGWN
jgi:hypothetical protein